jgi:1-deoxy-D-xylulose 5-phosphate reductoisomerase
MRRQPLSRSRDDRPLTFERPDLARFPALGLAIAALRAGRGHAGILNAANEVAVAAYLSRRHRVFRYRRAGRGRLQPSASGMPRRRPMLRGARH